MLKNISRILPFFIVTLLSIGGVELFYGVAERYLLFSPTKTTVLKSVTAQQDSVSKALEKHENYEVILDRNLFQSYLQQPEKVDPVKENPLVGLETTSLNLVLMGTVSGPEDRSRAIIMEKVKKKQDIYYKGDAVGEAQIKEILRGKVILTYQGKDEILDMVEASKYKTSPRAAVAPVPSRKRVVKRVNTKKRREIPKRIKPKTLPQSNPQVEQSDSTESGPDSDSDSAESAEPGADQDNEPAEGQSDEGDPATATEENDPQQDSDANGRDQIDN